LAFSGRINSRSRARAGPAGIWSKAVESARLMVKYYDFTHCLSNVGDLLAQFSILNLYLYGFAFTKHTNNIMKMKRYYDINEMALEKCARHTIEVIKITS